VVFGAGIAVGVAIDRVRGRPAGPPPGMDPGPQARRGPLPPWLERLDLTPDEHDRIKAILDAQKSRVDSVMNGVLPRFREISDSTFAQIRAALTPRQQEQFDRDRPRRELAPGMPGAPGGRGGRENMDGRGPPPGDARGRPPA
jgi:Spy/CpxP family protein refolding chaperone